MAKAKDKKEAKDKKTKPAKAAEAKAPQAEGGELKAEGLPVTVHAQYIRDVSFENPNAPDALRPGQQTPQMNVNIGLDARKIEDKDVKNLYEVALGISAESKRGDQSIFIAELQYGITVSIGESVPEDSHHPLLFIEIPRLAFPYARQIISDLTVQGGYPPLLLNPVDFYGLYIERFGKEAKKEAKKA